MPHAIVNWLKIWPIINNRNYFLFNGLNGYNSDSQSWKKAIKINNQCWGLLLKCFFFPRHHLLFRLAVAGCCCFHSSFFVCVHFPANGQWRAHSRPHIITNIITIIGLRNNIGGVRHQTDVGPIGNDGRLILENAVVIPIRFFCRVGIFISFWKIPFEKCHD